VQVAAAGLDRGTWHLMTGTPYLVRLVIGLRAPRRPGVGRDLAGRVVAVGADVTDFAVGDEVYGIAPGSYAEYVAVRADKLAHAPARLTPAQAAVVPVSGLTALQALVDVADVQAGQHVLITGASGGVGTYAVQIAKALRAEVTGVCSAAKREFVLGLGADHVLEYDAASMSSQHWADDSRRYDVIIDIAGNTPLRRLRRALSPTGTLVIVGGEGRGPVTGGLDRQLRAVLWSPFVRQRLTMVAAKERGSDLARLTAMIDDGAITPCVDRSYPLEQAAEAMRQLAAGQVRGKVAITVSPAVEPGER
jgi:NADPH:quinone reductase-like Zn-dependent oxidoreductase